MSEILASKDPLRPLNQDQIDAFKELILSRQNEDEPYPVSVLVERCSYDIKHAPFGGMEPTNWPRTTARYVYQPEIGRLFESVYDTTDDDEHIALLSHDLAGWNALYKMAYETSISSPDGHTGLYRYERDRAFAYLNPNPEVTTPRSPSRFWHIRPVELTSMSKLRERVEGGMPREMQLLGVLSTLSGLINTEANHLKWDGFRTKILCDELEITPAELRFMYEIASTFNPEKTPYLLLGLFSYADLLSHYLDDASEHDLESSLFTNKEVIEKATDAAFENLVSKNNPDAVDAWVNLAIQLSDETLAEILPVEIRRQRVHRAILTNLVNPNLVSIKLIDELAIYIDGEILSQECETLLQRLIEEPLERKLSDKESSDFARQLEQVHGINLLPEILMYGEYPYSKLIDAVVGYGEPGTTHTDIAQTMLMESSSYDPILRGMIDRYTELKKDECLRTLGQGYSYDDEPAWFDARAAKAKSYTKQIDDIEQRIIARASIVIEQPN